MKTEASKAINNTANNNTTPVHKTADPAKEKADLKQQVKKEKPVRNLESTMKVYEDLHTKIRQRRRLKECIDNLDEFEIAIEKDGDEMGGGHFQGCSIKIQDDNNNKFITNNPVVIEAVAVFVKNMCMDRLAGIEATIVLP